LSCTFLDYAGIRLAERVTVGPKVTFITTGHPVDPEERRLYLRVQVTRAAGHSRTWGRPG
jgi:acetyltransferase-like isoleucine patch superfamily enzyme